MKPQTLNPEHHLLGGSWVVITGALSKVTILITHIIRLITSLITTHELPPTTGRVRLQCRGELRVGHPPGAVPWAFSRGINK